ncbi:hypothetical protein D9Q98_006990 [Chlorella vulgaris]|uniref:Uncharacterized protein n=1 Tax=Chlorella vulgaris TaxID=3077 RepID=A0A9D4TJE9_CHLVU|nr:hypothetical protein D9Q98_006990 [Chlorella vulgaris]
MTTDHPSIAVVTGASRGIGRELTAELLRRGYTVLAAVRDPAKAKASPDQLANLVAGPSGSRLHFAQLDISSGASIDAFVEGLKARYQHFDLVINNAGIAEMSVYGETTEQHLKDCFQVNTFAPFLLTQSLWKAGLIGGKAGKSVVANISSLLGSSGTKEWVEYPAYAYRASKAALNNLSRYSDVALAKEGVSVVTLSPGYVSTDMNNNQGELTPEFSAQSVLKVVLDSGSNLHGTFLNYSGEELPW